IGPRTRAGREMHRLGLRLAIERIEGGLVGRGRKWRLGRRGGRARLPLEESGLDRGGIGRDRGPRAYPGRMRGGLRDEIDGGTQEEGGDAGQDEERKRIEPARGGRIGRAESRRARG